jgi:hypothetical protein
MTVRVKFEYKMEYFMKTWSDLAINGTGFWQVNEEELAWEFADSKYEDFKKFLEKYFVSFSGLDLGDIVLTVDEDDLKRLENEVRMYL